MVFFLLFTHYCLLSASKSSTFMCACYQVDRECDFAVGVHVPAGAVEFVVADFAEGDTFPAEAGGFPAQTCGVERGDGMEAGEKDDVGGGCRKDLRYGAKRKMEAALW